MKLRGRYVVRQVMNDIMAIPVGEAALNFNGMILLNEVSKVIWECLTEETDVETIVKEITDRYEISYDEAKADVIEFLDRLRAKQMLDE